MEFFSSNYVNVCKKDWFLRNHHNICILVFRFVLSMNELYSFFLVIVVIDCQALIIPFDN